MFDAYPIHFFLFKTEKVRAKALLVTPTTLLFYFTFSLFNIKGTTLMTGLYKLIILR